jgi:hypothetical protein
MGTTARRTCRIAAASTVTAALLLAGAVPAAADDGTTQGPITLSPEQATYVCTQRIPTILGRVDRLTTRIGADASTLGSTAWLAARAERAKEAGRTEVADRLQRRIDGRPEKLDRLADVKRRVSEFRDANCVA